jgi:hypothetical protein
MLTRRGFYAAAAVALLGIAARCALYSDVSIGPLNLIPSRIERGSDLQQMIRKADYLRAVELAPTIDARPRKNPTDLVALGTAELAAARYDAARQHLRAAIELNPPREIYADAAWALSQVEYMTNNFALALEWTEVADRYGLSVMKWHSDYLRALSDIPAYQFTTLPSDELPLRIGRPDVPRIDVRVNQAQEPTQAVIDSGAVLSIVSERLALARSIKRLPVTDGTFYGLLGEPITVRFGLLDSLELGAVRIENVPVAIMPDDKMRFFVTGRKEFRIDFLLGANLLKEFRIELNFSRNRVLFTRLTPRDRRPDPNQNLFFVTFRPHTRGTVNKRGWYLFVIDTGSEVTYLNEAQLAGLPINIYAPRVHSATLQGLGGAKKRGAKVENVEIGVDKWAGTFKTIPMYTGQERERAVGILGENFLKHFNVVIDFGRMRLELERR